MSHLNKLLEKMASVQEPEANAQEETSAVDYVYVEKLASAVDYLIENSDLVVKEAEGEMAYEEAPPAKEEKSEKPEKKEDSKDRLKALFAKRKGEKKDEKKEPKSEDKSEDKSEGKEEASDDESKEASFKNAVEKLRGNLLSKVASQETDKSVSFVNKLVSRLNASAAKEVAEEKVAEATEPEVPAAETAETTDTVVEEAKEASGGRPTLASMLETARGGSADNAEESVSGGVKTAAGQDVSLSDLLKGSLLKKIGQTEVN